MHPAEILSQIEELAKQQKALNIKLMALKRQMVGKSANLCQDINNRDLNNRDADEPKRGRGRPKKTTTVTSSIITEPYSPVPVALMHTVEGEMPNIYRYNSNKSNNNNKSNSSNNDHNPVSNLIYVIENDDLFIRDDNGMLYTIDSREVVGWYNPYASSSESSVKWLY